MLSILHANVVLGRTALVCGAVLALHNLFDFGVLCSFNFRGMVCVYDDALDGLNAVASWRQRDFPFFGVISKIRQ